MHAYLEPVTQKVAPRYSAKKHLAYIQSVHWQNPKPIEQFGKQLDCMIHKKFPSNQSNLQEAPRQVRIQINKFR